MIVRDLQFMQRPLSASMLMGDMGTSRTLEAINSLCDISASTVFSDAAMAHIDMVQKGVVDVAAKFVSAMEALRINTDIRVIDDETLLNCIPPSMYVPIMCMPELKDLHTEGKIYGFGIEAKSLPDEDIYARMINRGRFVYDGYTKDEKYAREWSWNSGDPRLTVQEVANLEESRRFIRDYITEQLKKGDDGIDPTAYPDLFINVTIK